MGQFSLQHAQKGATASDEISNTRANSYSIPSIGGLCQLKRISVFRFHTSSSPRLRFDLTPCGGERGIHGIDSKRAAGRSTVHPDERLAVP